MSLKKTIRTHFVAKLPQRLQLSIERFYLYHYYGDNYVGTEVKIMKKLCNLGKQSLDIGANMGVITLYLSKYSSHVYCFEPLPGLAEYLKHKFQGCNVSVENCALGNSNDRMSINLPSTGNSRFESRASLVHTYEDEYILGNKVTDVEKIEVSVKRLDDYQFDNIGFIKIDVEGYEFQVLLGGEKTIRNNMPNLLIEIEQRHHDESDNIYDIFKHITDYGYYGSFIHDRKLKPIDEFNLSMQDPCNEKTNNYVNNFIFTPSKLNKI